MANYRALLHGTAGTTVEVPEPVELSPYGVYYVKNGVSTLFPWHRVATIQAVKPDAGEFWSEVWD